MAWTLEDELKRLEKSAAFKNAVKKYIKENNIKMDGVWNGKPTARKAAAKLKAMLEAEIRAIQPGSNPLVDSGAIIVCEPINTITELGYPAVEITVRYDGESVSKESISPNHDGLRNVLVLYDVGYSHPIKGNLPYKTVGSGDSEKRVYAKRNIKGTDFINRVIRKFNADTKDYIVASRDGDLI